jgi:threonine/homoserine/homoserine lactone efflux protein
VRAAANVPFSTRQELSVTTALVGFTLFATLVTITPGPDTLLVLRNCLRGGRGSGCATGIGAAMGSLVWAAAAAVGLAATLQKWDVAFTVVRLAGAAYLIFLGAQTLWAFRPGAETAGFSLAENPEGPIPTTSRAFRQGLMSCVLNPKVGIFFVAVVPQFLPEGHPTFSTTLTFGIVDAVVAATWLLLVSLLASRMLTWLRRPQVNVALERVAGVVLVALGLAAAAETG